MNTSSSPAPSIHAVPDRPVVCDPDHVGVPAGSADRLQEVLPVIKDLAMRVGGIRRLDEIVHALAQDAP